MTSVQILASIKDRTAGWQNNLHKYAHVLNADERWVAQVLAQSPAGQADSVETKTGTALGALSIDKAVSKIVTTGAATGTLANGYEGQFKTIFLLTDGGDFVLTPANLRAGTTITFDAANDWVLLQFVAGEWNVVVNSNATVA